MKLGQKDKHIHYVLSTDLESSTVGRDDDRLIVMGKAWYLIAPAYRVILQIDIESQELHLLILDIV